eukprot:scaffold1363_cov356-Prasinococcus_capsulatus_cf.AAC.8
MDTVSPTRRGCSPPLPARAHCCCCRCCCYGVPCLARHGQGKAANQSATQPSRAADRPAERTLEERGVSVWGPDGALGGLRHGAGRAPDLIEDPRQVYAGRRMANRAGGPPALLGCVHLTYAFLAEHRAHVETGRCRALRRKSGSCPGWRLGPRFNTGLLVTSKGSVTLRPVLRRCWRCLAGSKTCNGRPPAGSVRERAWRRLGAPDKETDTPPPGVSSDLRQQVWAFSSRDCSLEYSVTKKHGFWCLGWTTLARQLSCVSSLAPAPQAAR